MWIFLALTSALLSAAAAVTQKKVLFKDDAYQFSFKLSIFNLVFSIPFFFFLDVSSVNLNSLLLLYLKTIIASLAFLNVMLTLKNLDISGSLPMMALTPGLVAFAAFFTLGDSLLGLEILGIILLIIGTYGLEMQRSENLLAPLTIFIKSKKHHYILFALLLFTATAVIDRLLLTKMNMQPLTLIAFQHLFFAINFAVILLFKSQNPVNVFKYADKSLFKWIIVISIITIAYRWTNIEAIKLAPVALVLSLKRTSVFFASLIGGRLFNEKYLLRRVISAAIIVTGAILIINA
jgi:drug/metabolite transporter (DMT)-like permease